jgi:hypothetical protein
MPLLIILKLGLNTFLAYKILNPTFKRAKDTYNLSVLRFFICMMAVLLISAQFFGGISNLYATYQAHKEFTVYAVEQAGVSDYSQLNDVQIQEYSQNYQEALKLSKEELIQSYFQAIFFIVLYPFFLALISFILWLKIGGIFENKKIETDK